MTDVRDIIKEVKRLSAFGQLARDNTLTYPQVMQIIAYYQDPDRAQSDAEGHIATEKALQEKLNAANGKVGGLTKKVNALTKQISDQNELRDNNRRLSRIAVAASELVEVVERAAERGNAFTSGDDVDLTGLGQFARLKVETE